MDFVMSAASMMIGMLISLMRMVPPILRSMSHLIVAMGALMVISVRWGAATVYWIFKLCVICFAAVGVTFVAIFRAGRAIGSAARRK